MRMARVALDEVVAEIGRFPGRPPIAFYSWDDVAGAVTQRQRCALRY